MAKVEKLTGSTFLDQTIRCGFFSEQIPDCFSSASFADNVALLSDLCTGSGTSPEILSTYKNGISRRVVSVPNPSTYLYAIQFMSNNWKEILEAAKSPNSLSPITYLSPYRVDSTEEFINCENMRERQHGRSDFIKNIRECIGAALGFRYKLSADISTCYNSIYTHSIAWALCGKTEAKKVLHAKQSAKTDAFLLANELDKRTRALKSNERTAY